MNRRALSLVEILISVILIALVLGGLANIFLAAKRYITLGRSRTAGGELGRAFLDPLQDRFIRQDLWTDANNCLTNPPNGCPGSQTIGPTTYTPSWNIFVLPGTNSRLRCARVDISWPQD